VVDHWANLRRTSQETVTPALLGGALDLSVFMLASGEDAELNLRVLAEFQPLVKSLEAERHDTFNFYFDVRRVAAASVLSVERGDLKLMSQLAAPLNRRSEAGLPPQLEADAARSRAMIHSYQARLHAKEGNHRDTERALISALSALNEPAVNESTDTKPPVLTAGYRNDVRQLLVRFDLEWATGNDQSAKQTFRTVVEEWNRDRMVDVFYQSVLLARDLVTEDSSLADLEILPPLGRVTRDSTQNPVTFVNNDCLILSASMDRVINVGNLP
jgi:hypothetical protein